MAADFFVVPTVTYRLLFVLVILAHERRRVVHVAVTDHPTAAWTAQQLRNAFPNDECPSYLLHDRDSAFAGVAGTIAAMRIQDVVTAPRSPWQNAYVERFIGSIRRECLDHVIVLSAAGLQRMVNGLRRVLHALADASGPRQGLADSTARDAADGRAHRRGSRGQRAAPSLRPRGRIVTTHRPRRLPTPLRERTLTLAIWARSATRPVWRRGRSGRRRSAVSVAVSPELRLRQRWIEFSVATASPPPVSLTGHRSPLPRIGR